MFGKWQGYNKSKKCNWNHELLFRIKSFVGNIHNCFYVANHIYHIIDLIIKSENDWQQQLIAKPKNSQMKQTVVN